MKEKYQCALVFLRLNVTYPKASSPAKVSSYLGVKVRG